jgi:hypothetical protein
VLGSQLTFSHRVDISIHQRCTGSFYTQNDTLLLYLSLIGPDCKTYSDLFSFQIPKAKGGKNYLCLFVLMAKDLLKSNGIFRRLVLSLDIYSDLHKIVLSTTMSRACERSIHKRDEELGEYRTVSYATLMM